jgi:steroid delta-isomerase-like uncharacterized protein
VAPWVLASVELVAYVCEQWGEGVEACNTPKYTAVTPASVCRCVMVRDMRAGVTPTGMRVAPGDPWLYDLRIAITYRAKKELHMSAENKALARRFIEEVWNKHNPAAAGEIIAPHYVLHDPATPEKVVGIEGFKRFFHRYSSAFPDQHFTIQDLIAEGDRVVLRWEVEGTHTGPLAGIPPTGKRIRVTGITISRIENGRAVEDHINWDALGLMQQLGLVPNLASG